MKYESMLREELIAELKAWESKFNEKVIENKAKLRGEYQELLKMTDEEKYQTYWIYEKMLSYLDDMNDLLNPTCSLVFANKDNFDLMQAYKKLKEKYDAFDILYQRKKAGVR